MSDVTDETDSISTVSTVSTKDTVKEDLDSQEKRLELSESKKEYCSRILALLVDDGSICLRKKEIKMHECYDRQRQT